jgi:FAD synthetase
MDLYRFGGGMKSALGEYLGCEVGKGVKGMLMGTRKGDPNGGKFLFNLPIHGDEN